jgi:membrane-bound lytic murein transglycosylase B
MAAGAGQATETTNLAPAVQDERMEIGTEAGFAAWVSGFRSRALAAGIAPATFDTAFRGARFDASVLERDRNQNEFTKTIWDYLDSAVSEARIDQRARGTSAQPRAVLERIEAAYGVRRRWWSPSGGWKAPMAPFGATPLTLSALATLAYDGRRGAFFEGELLAALQILQAGRRRRPPRCGAVGPGRWGTRSSCPRPF